MQPTLFLITSAHRGWTRLRGALRTYRDLHLVGETRHGEGVAPDIARLQPAVILAATDTADRPLIQCVEELHEASPASKLILLGDEAALDRGALPRLGHLAAANLTWSDLRHGTMPRCLAVVVEDNLVVGSRAVLEMYLSPPERRRRPRRQSVVLTDRQRVILQGLAAGLERDEIARTAYCSKRTVDREILELQDELGACSEFTLGVAAAQLGFVP